MTDKIIQYMINSVYKNPAECGSNLNLLGDELNRRIENLEMSQGQVDEALTDLFACGLKHMRDNPGKRKVYERLVLTAYKWVKVYQGDDGQTPGRSRTPHLMRSTFTTGDDHGDFADGDTERRFWQLIPELDPSYKGGQGPAPKGYEAAPAEQPGAAAAYNAQARQTMIEGMPAGMDIGGVQQWIHTVKPKVSELMMWGQHALASYAQDEALWMALCEALHASDPRRRPADLAKLYTMVLQAAYAATAARATHKGRSDIVRSDTSQDLIEGLLPKQGLVILAGRPKVGKSFLALDAALAVAGIRPFLGSYPCTDPGNVLYLALDMNINSYIDRFDRMIGTAYADNDKLHVQDQIPKLASGRFTQRALAWIHDVENPRLIVVDMMTNLLSQHAKEINPYLADYEDMRKLDDLCTAQGIAILALTHEGKAKSGIEDISRAIIGTTGIAAVASGIWLISATDNHGGAKFATTGRDLPEHELMIKAQHDAPHGWFFPSDEEGINPQGHAETRQQMLGIIYQHQRASGYGIRLRILQETLEDQRLANDLPAVNRTYFYKLVDGLVRDHLATKARRSRDDRTFLVTLSEKGYDLAQLLAVKGEIP